MSQATKSAALAISLGVLAAIALGSAARASMVDLTLEESACIADPADAGSWRILLRFEIPDVLDGATVDLAVLRAELDIDCEEEREISVEALPVTCAWSAEEVVWGEDWQSGEDVWDEFRGSIASVVAGEQGELRVDVTPIVGQWLRHDAAAHGLVLAPLAEGPTAALMGPPVEMSLRVWYTGARRNGAAAGED